LRQRPLTAAAVARVFRCSKPVAYERIAELRRRIRGTGSTVQTTKVRENKTGPLSVAYFVKTPHTVVQH
jgi:hypothetical protein